MTRALGALWIACAALAQPDWAGGVVVIGDADGFVGPQVQALSGNGAVAGGSDLFAKGFRWNGAFVPVPALPGGTASFVRDLSEDGAVAVGSASDGTLQHAVRWTAGAGTVSLGTLAPGQPGMAHAVSDDGSVAVGSNGSSAFRWTAGGGMVAIAATGSAWGVSGDGSVVTGQLFGVVYQAYRWTQATGAVGLGTLAGHESSTARAISSDGTTIVGGSYDAESDTEEPFRWTQSGGMVGLGNLQGCRLTTATAVSGDGGVVTGDCWLEDGVTRRSFVWTAGTGIRFLEVFLALRQVTLEDPLVAPLVTAVSDDGQRLAVVDEDPNLIRSFLIDVAPPVPGLHAWTFVALALAVVVAGFRAVNRTGASGTKTVARPPGYFSP